MRIAAIPAHDPTMRARHGLALAMVALALPGPSSASFDGPDRFGNSWSDHRQPGTDPSLPPTTTGPFPILLGDDEVSPPIPLGFAFPYYGQSHSELAFSSNGWLTFDVSVTDSAPTPQLLPSAATPNALVAWYWRDLSPPQTLEYWTSPGAIVFHVVTKPTLASYYNVEIYIALYASGIIKLRYERVALASTASVGIENQVGDDGLAPWYLGSGAKGFVLEAGATLEFFPPPDLDCTAPRVIACGDRLSLNSPNSVSPNVTRYGCSAGASFGNERVLQFTNPAFNDVSVALTVPPPRKNEFDLFFLGAGACNEHLCLAGGGGALALPILPPGDYQIVIDGRTASDNGPFEVTVACSAKGGTASCQPPGSPGVPGLTSGASHWSLYASCASPSLDGPEFVHEVSFTAPGNLRAVLTHDPAIDLDLVVLGPDTFDAPNHCLAWGDDAVTVFGPPSGTYYVMVEGRPGGTLGGAGDFELSVACDVLLDCSGVAADLLCSTATVGDTSGSPNRVEQYACSTEPLSGGEAVYRFHNDSPRDVSFVLSGTPGLTLQLLADGCDEAGCLKQADDRLVYRQLPAGDYLVVVDGRNAAAGPFSLMPICSTYVDPPSGSWTLELGQTVHETKRVFVSAAIPRSDIVFAMDLTGSMSGPLSRLNATTNALIDAVASAVNDVRFGLISFEDYPASFSSPCGYTDHYGDIADLPYRLELPITDDRNALGLAIAALRLGNGSDPPESYARVLSELVDDASNIGWRSGAPAIAVMIGDNLPHDCGTSACGVARAPNGTDPGRDAIVGTADDIGIVDAMMKLEANGITPLFLETSGVPSRLQQWQCWTGLAGGTAVSAPGGTLPATVPPLLQELVGTANSFTCQTLEARPSPGFAGWLTGVTPVAYTNVTLPAELSFEFDIGPPPGTLPGSYRFTVDFLCDGIKLTAQDVGIDVPAPCTDPVGAIANHLTAVRNLDDVVLDWGGGALTPPSYNVHREDAKALLDPPVAPAIGNVDLVETYVDAGAVPRVPALRFYEVYGRDCSGNSIFN